MVEILWGLYFTSIISCIVVNRVCNHRLVYRFRKVGLENEFQAFQDDYKKLNKRSISDRLQYLVYLCPLVNILISIVEITGSKKAFYKALELVRDFKGKEEKYENSN